MSRLTISDLETIAGPHTTRDASDVGANWPAIVEEAREQEVIVTNSDAPEAVVMSAERYAALQEAARGHDPLRRLRDEFDRQLAPLREPDAAERLRDLFAASPQELADAANAADERE
jgi:prevent-host-death family protein